jgi:hypothetical protein
LQHVAAAMITLGSKTAATTVEGIPLLLSKSINKAVHHVTAKTFREGSAPNLQKVGSKYSADEIKEVIAKGRGSMPGGIIQGEDADKVAEWLAAKK